MIGLLVGDAAGLHAGKQSEANHRHGRLVSSSERSKYKNHPTSTTIWDEVPQNMESAFPPVLLLPLAMMAEQPKPEIGCALLIAYLEGKKNIAFPENEVLSLTLEGLDRRLKNLEICSNVQRQPPTAMTTWDCLAWRLTRLCVTIGGAVPQVLPKTCFEELLQPDGDVSIDTIEGLISDLAIKCKVNRLKSPCPKLVVDDDEQTLHLLSHRLHYVAGKQRYRINRHTTTKRQLYIIAAELTFYADSGISRPRTVWGPPPPPPPGWNSNWNRPCNCACSSRGRKGPVRANRWKRSFKTRAKNFFRFEWVRHLACWRRKVDDDSSSISSGSSRTCVS